MTDEIIIRFSVKDDGSPVIERVNNKIKQTKEESKALAPGLEKARMSLSNFASTNAALIGVLAGVGIALGKVIKDHVEYANQVRNLSLLSGASTEDTSRFVQVLDDYKIGAEEALAATRALTREGHAPSIDTLAKLSDQYLALNTVEARNEFLIKNLGRAGLQWAEVLQKGSKALLEQGAAIDENLILTQKMVDDARRAEIAMDNWNDTIGAFKTQLAAELLPVLTDTLNLFKQMDRAMELTAGLGLKGIPGTKAWADAMEQAREEQEAATDAMIENSDAADLNADSIDGLTDSTEAAEKAAKALSDHLEGLLSSMFAIESESRNHAKTLDDLAQKERELTEEKQRLTYEMWQEKQAGEQTNEQYDEYVKNISEINAAQDENTKAIEEAKQAHEEAGKQRVYDLVQARLAADGIINSGEFEYLQDIAVQQGLVSRSAADRAIEESRLADQMVANFAKTQGPMDQTLSTMQQIASYDGVMVDFGVNFSTNGGIGQDWQTAPGGHAYPWMSRDNGGSGVAGTPYMIGTGAQPEMFVPKTDGTFIPNADKLGSTYNITIHNPKKETAENSIRRSLKSLSYVGAPA